jgi:hypothetical protein
MDTLLEHPKVVSVRACDRLDAPESRRLVEEVRARALAGMTFLIVISLAGAREIHWDALCRLERAADAWRARSHTVVFETATPKQRALLAIATGSQMPED